MSKHGEKKWFVQAAAGKTHGPFTHEQLARLTAKGVISRNTLLREAASGGTWLRADQMPALFLMPSESVASGLVKASGNPPPIPLATQNTAQDALISRKSVSPLPLLKAVVENKDPIEGTTARLQSLLIICVVCSLVLIAMLSLVVMTVDKEFRKIAGTDFPPQYDPVVDDSSELYGEPEQDIGRPDYNTSNREMKFPRGSPLHSGSGFLIAPNLVLTNRHVVSSASIPIGARFWVSNDTSLSSGIWARVIKVSKDPDVDLGLLQLEYPLSIQPIPIRREPPEEGEDFGLLGYPLAGEPVFEFKRHTSFGRINSLQRDRKNFTHDASSNPGNSGGPCVDMRGNIIGVLWGGFNSPELGFPRAFAVSNVEAKKFLENAPGYQSLAPRDVKRDAPDIVRLVGEAVFLIVAYEK